MDLYEHQGKELLARYGIATGEGRIAYTPEEAEAAARDLGGMVVIKAQVLVGGRGKAGGIKLTEDPRRRPGWRATSSGSTSRGTSSAGCSSSGPSTSRRSTTSRSRSTVAPGDRCSCCRPWAGWTSRRSRSTIPRPSPGSTSIRGIGLKPFFAATAAVHRGRAGRRAPGRRGAHRGSVPRVHGARRDARRGQPGRHRRARGGRAPDCKFTVDDNALFRHADIEAMRDPCSRGPQEQMARERGLTYVKLDGDIGILGNGAGLVMSTLDVVAQAGGSPANFLDAGGGSKADAIAAGLEVILSTTGSRAVLVNIFGGITRCDEVANGLIAAFDQIKSRVPFVVRLDGTNDAEGRRLLKEANLPGVHVDERCSRRPEGSSSMRDDGRPGIPPRSTATGTGRRATEVRDGAGGRPRRDPQDRRPGRPGGQGAASRTRSSSSSCRRRSRRSSSA